VLAHRVILTAEAQMAQRTAEGIIADLVRRVPVPAPQPDAARPHPRPHQPAHRAAGL
jgi:MoxR-like ATPase